jgi:hypothetical protein
MLCQGLPWSELLLKHGAHVSRLISSQTGSTECCEFTGMMPPSSHAGLLSIVGVALLIAPNMLSSFAVGFIADWRAGAVPIIMVGAVAVKEMHLPERWSAAGRYDYSMVHSHVLWHLLVWLVQTLYLLVYLANFDQQSK